MSEYAPAFLFQRALSGSYRDKISEYTPAPSLPAPAVELTEDMGIGALVKGFQGGELTDAGWQELYAWYLRDPVWKDRVERVLARTAIYALRAEL